jgi:hypothetical protein
MPSWERAATIFAIALIAAVIAFGGPQRNAANPFASLSDVQTAVIEK